MNPKQIKQKIKEVEYELEDVKINMASIDYYEKLLLIHNKLWDFLYFKIHQEKTYLDPPEEENK